MGLDRIPAKQLTAPGKTPILISLLKAFCRVCGSLNPKAYNSNESSRPAALPQKALPRPQRRINL
jgi:hypothetical protein